MRSHVVVDGVVHDFPTSTPSSFISSRAFQLAALLTTTHTHLLLGGKAFVSRIDWLSDISGSLLPSTVSLNLPRFFLISLSAIVCFSEDPLVQFNYGLVYVTLSLARSLSAILSYLIKSSVINSPEPYQVDEASQIWRTGSRRGVAVMTYFARCCGYCSILCRPAPDHSDRARHHSFRKQSDPRESKTVWTLQRLQSVGPRTPHCPHYCTTTPPVASCAPLKI